MEALVKVADMDYSIVRHATRYASGSVRQITHGMQSLGLIHDDTEKALMMVSGALQVVVGGATIARSVQSLVAIKTASEAVAAGIETAANATNPIGWGKIALATAMAGVVSVGVYAAVTRIRADLSTPIGRQEAAERVAEAMA